MAEFCLKHFNEINCTGYKENEVSLQDDFCESCGEIKPCVAHLYPPCFLYRIKRLFGKE